MRGFVRYNIYVFILVLIGCGGKEEKKKTSFSYEEKSSTEKTTKKSEATPPSKQIHLENKGIGPITSVNLDKKIDRNMAAKGAEIFKKLCAACHKPDKKFIGPAAKGVLERRSPEWVMNIMLNPLEMIQKDDLTKALQKEFNGAIMPLQNVNEADARALLEYFRTL